VTPVQLFSVEIILSTDSSIKKNISYHVLDF
jgi:hypothetical protein